MFDFSLPEVSNQKEGELVPGENFYFKAEGLPLVSRIGSYICSC